MFDAAPLVTLILIFTASAAAVWIAGIYIARTTDVLEEYWNLGEALGGMILLAIVTNLPEIAITASAALHHDLDLAVGNILGGIAIQTVVLVILDVFGVGKSAPLMHRAASPSLTLEGGLVVAVLSVAVMGSQLPSSLVFAGVTPAGLLIVVLWVAGLWIIKRMCGPRRRRTTVKDKHPNRPSSALVIFLIGALATLAGGVMLELSSEAIANKIGMSGAVFGATALAAVTSLPEVSTGLASVKLKDYELAVSDIFGGNAFLPVLFMGASLLSGEAVLPHAHRSDIYLAGLGILLTVVYITGMVVRSRRQVARMGLDSLAVLIIYALGMLGLAAIR